MRRSIKLVAVVLLLALLAAAPFLLSSFYLRVLGEVLLMAMLTMSINILLGYTGLAPLGHAALFGVGTYTVGYLTTKLGQPFAVTIPAGILMTVFVSAVFGLIAVRTSGIYFLMITLAEGMIIWGLAFRWNSITNAENGIRGIGRPEWLGPYWIYYYLILVVAIVIFLMVYRIVNSPFGLTLKGIREGERRMRTLGYNVTLHKYIGFLISGFFAGVAGSLFAFHNNFVSPTTVEFARSAQALLMVILGGAGTLAGPLLGAFVITFGRNQLSLFTNRWPMIIGAIYVITILVAPDGIVGAWNRLLAYLQKGRPRAVRLAGGKEAVTAGEEEKEVVGIGLVRNQEDV